MTTATQTIHKVKFSFAALAATGIDGATGHNATSFTFIRLGDT
jgi:hypothetical protein